VTALLAPAIDVALQVAQHAEEDLGRLLDDLRAWVDKLTSAG